MNIKIMIMIMNTSINKIENLVRHFANKINIKLDVVKVEFEPSYEYEVEDGEYDSTDNTYSVAITLKNPELMTQKKAKKFIGKLESKFYTSKHYRKLNECVFAYFENFDIED